MFRDAVTRTHPNSDDDAAESNYLRLALSDLGHADFFVNGSRRWRVLAPAIVGLERDRKHLVVGGRSRAFVRRVEEKAANLGVRAERSYGRDDFMQLRLHGLDELVGELAHQIDVRYLPNAARFLGARSPQLRSVVTGTRGVPPPLNWAISSLSLEDGSWVPGPVTGTVQEHTNRHGIKRYFLKRLTGELIEMDKRSATYGAAIESGNELIHYDPFEQVLAVPRWAPLPAEHSRAACLASGERPDQVETTFRYTHISEPTATVLCVALGQSIPKQAGNG